MRLVSEHMVAEEVPCGPDLSKHVASFEEFRDAGFDELYIQQIGGHHESFFERYASEVLPCFREGSERAAGLVSGAAR